MASDRATTLARGLVSGLDHRTRDLFSGEVFAALEALGYRILLCPEPEITGDCSVAGSFDAGPPPTINVVQVASIGRRYFTALHEFGHRLVEDDTAIHDLLFDEPDGGLRLTEDVCDAVAAELLLPDEYVDRFIGPTGPTARGVLDLMTHSAASREACCVRAAQRLPGPGHVMVARRGVALFTASRGTRYRVARNSPQGDDHITTVAAGRTGPVRDEASVRYASGAVSDRFFAEAAVGPEGFVVAVFVDGRAPWLDGPTLYSDDRRNEVEACCPRCEEDFTTTTAPCPTCRDYRHLWRPDGTDGCGRCSCEPNATEKRTCPECFVHRPPTDFSTPDSEQCDYCTGLK